VLFDSEKLEMYSKNATKIRELVDIDKISEDWLNFIDAIVKNA